jgi:hypothetical protein
VCRMLVGNDRESFGILDLDFLVLICCGMGLGPLA